MKYFPGNLLRSRIFLIVAAFILFTSCNIVKKESKTPTLLKTETAQQSELLSEVNRYARVNSMRAKMDLQFEDNSFAEFGTKEKYRTADGEIVVQRPGMILLKVQAPFIRTDIAQMTSDGLSFRVAVLNDGGSGKYKKFVKGTNKADYSRLQKTLSSNGNGNGEAKAAKENVNAFANLRPQHFTDAMLVRPIDPANVYTQSSIFEIEDDNTVNSKSPVRKVMRGYYLLDEYVRREEGTLKISRRFWFDRVGGIRLAKQQIFDEQGEIESDIVYGKEGKLTETTDYVNLPLEIQVTRPKEKYSMKLSYQTPDAVSIGKKYPDAAFVLQNSWNLEEVDLDKKLSEVKVDQPTSNAIRTGVTRYQ
ncbi:MAG: hypothetical protein ABL999_05300 [Pyrinomonadaceae bacterium]